MDDQTVGDAVSDPIQPQVQTPREASPVPDLSEPYYRAPLPDAFIRFWRKYATFSGRASRAEFWWWILVSACIGLFLSFLGSGNDPMPVIATVLKALWLIATAVPTAALTWRRIHDSNHSGWWAVPVLALSAPSVTIGPFSLRTLLDAAVESGNPVLAPIAITISVLGMLFMVQLFIFAVARPNHEGSRFDEGVSGGGTDPSTLPPQNRSA